MHACVLALISCNPVERSMFRWVAHKTQVDVLSQPFGCVVVPPVINLVRDLHSVTQEWSIAVEAQGTTGSPRETQSVFRPP